LAAAIGRLADNPGLRLRMGMAGRAFVERTYPWERCVDRQEAILAEAAGRA
jgi:glycosyltransferase involved in cell wall biosynthesis